MTKNNNNINDSRDNGCTPDDQHRITLYRLLCTVARIVASSATDVYAYMPYLDDKGKEITNIDKFEDRHIDVVINRLEVTQECAGILYRHLVAKRKELKGGSDEEASTTD